MQRSLRNVSPVLGLHLRFGGELEKKERREGDGVR